MGPHSTNHFHVPTAENRIADQVGGSRANQARGEPKSTLQVAPGKPFITAAGTPSMQTYSYEVKVRYYCCRQQILHIVQRLKPGKHDKTEVWRLHPCKRLYVTPVRWLRREDRRGLSRLPLEGYCTALKFRSNLGAVRRPSRTHIPSCRAGRPYKNKSSLFNSVGSAKPSRKVNTPWLHCRCR